MSVAGRCQFLPHSILNPLEVTRAGLLPYFVQHPRPFIFYDYLKVERLKIIEHPTTPIGPCCVH